MKQRMLVFAATAAGVLVLAAAATASHGPGGPNRDFAAGGGKTVSDQFNINAHSGPLGQFARGHLRSSNTPASPLEFVVNGDVLCLSTLGNVATIGGRTTDFEASDFGFIGDESVWQGFRFTVEDRSAVGLPDEISNEIIFLTPQTVCPPPNPLLTSFPVMQGNVVVHDG